MYRFLKPKFIVLPLPEIFEKKLCKLYLSIGNAIAPNWGVQ